MLLSENSGAPANKTLVKASSSTAESAITTSSVITSNMQVPTALASSAVMPVPPLAFTSLPTPFSSPIGLQGPFEAPNLIVPIDKTDPTRVVGNGYFGRLSPTMSTVFVFDVLPEQKGKTCNLAFYMPPASPFPDFAPVQVRSPGGMTVSSIGQQAASAGISANDVGSSQLVGRVPSIDPANQYNIASFPCAAGQKVAYQVESTGGLAMDFFQMTFPPLGLFMSVS